MAGSHTPDMHVSGKSDGCIVPGKPPNKGRENLSAEAVEVRRPTKGNAGQGKPETFDFLGFTHMCGKTRIQKRFLVRRKTVKKRLRAALKRVKTILRSRMHDPISEVGEWLQRVVLGYYKYHAVSGNCEAMRAFQRDIVRY